jgi:hypothetical protein
MKNNESNLKVKLEALLKPNPHEHERYLACCTLLVKSHPKAVCDILEQHPHLLTFIFQLIRWNDDGKDEVMKRLGLRVLYLYLSNTQCDGGFITPQDWRFLVDLLVQRCQEDVIMDILDVELLQILFLVVDKARKQQEFTHIYGMYILPDIVMNRFIIAASGRQQQQDENCTISKPTMEECNNDENHGKIIQFLKKILDSDHEDSQDLTIQDLFFENMALFFAGYASWIQFNHYSKSMVAENPLTIGFVKNTIGLLFGDKHRLFSAKNTSQRQQHVPFLLHYALVVFVSQDLSFENHSIIQGEIKRAKDDDFMSLLQKLVLSGISSLLDSKGQTRRETMFEFHSIKTIIRTMTIHILGHLLETCGVEWTKPRHENSTGSLGTAGNYCTMMRLVAGEFRIVLGRIVDDQSMRTNGDNHAKTEKTQDDNIMTNNNALEVLHTCRDCIRIGLLALKHMLDLASEKEEEDSSNDTRQPHTDSLDFNTDSILHIRQTLEDFLNSCIQFVLEETNQHTFVHWKNECAFECCRFIGAYLSQIDIFDYDVMEKERHEEDNYYYTHNTHESTQIDTVTILRAIKQCMEICFVWDDEQDKVSQSKAMTIFPCLLSILTCCNDSRHASLVTKYLFRSTTISSTIEKILNSIVESTNKTDPFSFSLDENINVISWCCFLITAIAEFQSTRQKQVTTKIMDKQNMASLLVRVSEQYFERIQQDGTADFGNILVMLLDAWKAVTTHVDDNVSNSCIMMNVYSFLHSKGLV